jgi:hypothetical protein
MAIGNTPAMFVSSTCYDLKQVRADLRNFIESLGLQPILSEYDSFPVNPDVGAVENCLRVVDENADILLLIVGGKYGKPFEQDKSVTNMEYLRARAKGIPIYVFVQRSVLNILPVWKDNPGGNFQMVADSPKLFEFVASLMDVEGIWVFPFDLAQEVIDTLRKQLAYLFMNALNLRKRVKTLGLPESLAHLQGIPLKLVIERPVAWEVRLFNHVLAQEIARIKERRWDLDYGIAFGRGDRLTNRLDVLNWASKQFAEAQRLARITDQLINVAFQDAMAPPGIPADPQKLIYVARSLAETYRHAIEWAIESKRVVIDKKKFRNLVRSIGMMLNEMIRQIEEFSERTLRETEEAVLHLPDPREEKKVLHFTLEITVSNLEEVNEEMDKLRNDYDDDDDDDGYDDEE